MSRERLLFCVPVQFCQGCQPEILKDIGQFGKNHGHDFHSLTIERDLPRKKKADYGFHMVNIEDRCEKSMCEKCWCVLRKGKPHLNQEEFPDGMAYLVMIWPFE